MKTVLSIVLFFSLFTCYSQKRSMEEYFKKNIKYAGIGVSGSMIKKSKSTDKALGYSVSPYCGIFINKHISVTASLNLLQQKYWLKDKIFVDNILNISPFVRYYFLKSNFFFVDAAYNYGIFWQDIDKSNKLIINAIGLGIGLNYFIPEKIKLGIFTGKLGLELYIRQNLSLNNVDINLDVPFGGDGKIGINYYFN